jgi:hypothetical protein
MQINKSDRNDAVGIAPIMQCGRYEEVRVKDLDSHAIKALILGLSSAGQRWCGPSTPSKSCEPLVEFATRYNETWLVARYGYRTLAQVRADQCRLDQNTTADQKLAA